MMFVLVMRADKHTTRFPTRVFVNKKTMSHDVWPKFARLGSLLGQLEPLATLSMLSLCDPAGLARGGEKGEFVDFVT